MDFLPEFLYHLNKLISFKSDGSNPTLDKPFGEGVDNALNYFLHLASSFGFKTKNYDGYMGEIEFGEGEELGIIGHLDVVPAGENWTVPAHTLTNKDGIIYGRGVQDDIAPTLLCLYALKSLKDSNIKVNRKFRLFLGCDEESGWTDVDYFLTKSHFPEYGFSPDGNFPISYAEKGVTVVNFSLPKLKNFSSLSGGTVINAVCAYCSAVATNDGIDKEKLEKYGLKLTGNLIESFGVSAHGSCPHLGKNAILPLFKYFYDMGENVGEIIDYLFLDKGNLKALKNEQGNLTMSPDLLSEKDGKVVISCDCRIPYPLQSDDLIKVISTFNIPFTTEVHHDSVAVDKDGPFVSLLLSAYNSVTGRNDKPISQGGSTFARVFKKGCAFGPEFIGQDARIHNSDEHVSIEDIKKLYEIYKRAIFGLANFTN